MINIFKKIFKRNKICSNCNGEGYVKTKRNNCGWIESQCGHCYGTGKIK